MGGNRSGKTEGMIVTKCLQLLGLHKARPLAPREGGWRFYLCSQNRDKQREVVQEKLKAYLPDTVVPKNPDGSWKIYSTRDTYDFMELIDPRVIAKQGKNAKKRNLHGARIYFKTYDSGITAFEGGSIDAAYLDEEPPSKNIYEAILARLLDRTKVGNGYLTCAMTPDPDKGFTWTYDEIVDKDGEDPDRLLIMMSTYDNKANLGEEEIRKLESRYDEDTRKARIYGLHVAREGYVLPDFKPVGMPHGNLVDPFKPDWSMFTPYESTDWGFRHPWHWGFYAVNKEDEIFKVAEIHLPRLSVPQMKRMVYLVRKRLGYKEPYLVVGDPSMSKKESTGYSVFDQLAFGADEEDDIPKDQYVWIGEGEPPEDKSHQDYIKFGISVQPANNDRDQGWISLNARMKFEPGIGRPGWYYCSNCVQSIKEAKQLTWPKESTGNDVSKSREIARKKNDDAPDTDRYLSNANPVYVADFNPLIGYNDEYDENAHRHGAFDYEDEELDSITAW